MSAKWGTATKTSTQTIRGSYFREGARSIDLEIKSHSGPMSSERWSFEVLAPGGLSIKSPHTFAANKVAMEAAQHFAKLVGEWLDAQAKEEYGQ